MRANWTEEEVELFKRTYPVRTSSQMKELFPQYTLQQMLTKATGLGIKKGKEVVKESRRQSLKHREDEIWSDEEKKVLIDVFPIKGSQGVFEKLNGSRSVSGINRMARRLKLKRIQKNLIWEQTDYSIKKEKGLSIQITYKGW